jgi:hypothetical protein
MMKRGPRIGTVLKSLSIADLRTAIEHRRRAEERALRELARKRRSLEAQLNAINSRVREIEGNMRALNKVAPRRGPGRPPGGATKRGRTTRKARGRRTSRRPPRTAGAKRPARGRARAAKKPHEWARMTYKDMALEVLRSAKGPMHQRDIARVLEQKSGVKPKSRNLDRTLGLVMSKDKRFKKVGRATYAAG